MQKLLESLGIPAAPGVTAIVGGGGKTTLMFRLAEELAAAGKIAVATTTTKIYPPEDPEIFLLCERDDFASVAEAGQIYCIGKMGPEGKLHYPGDEAFAAACKHSDRVFVEADGARHCPAKAPGENEPVIPEGADSLIAVAGLDALGGRICDVCFRPELVASLLGAAPEDILTPEMLARLLLSPEGQMKALPEGAAFAVVLNKADTEERLELARQTAEHIRALRPGCTVLAAALAQRYCIRALFM